MSDLKWNKDQNGPTVAILILNWNGWPYTIECLESVQRLTYSNHRMVVLDNGSTDGSMDKIKAWAAGELPVESKFFSRNPVTTPLRWIEYDRAAAESGGRPEKEAEMESLSPGRPMVLIQTGSNLGFAGGNNVGIRYALKRGADYIWLLNNDTVVDQNALTEMMKPATSDGRIGIVGSKLLSYGKPETIETTGGGRIIPWLGVIKHIGAGRRDAGGWDKNIEPDYICGASLLIGATVLEKVGLLDETYFFYAEDADLGERVRRSGFTIKYCPAGKVWHRQGGSLNVTSPKADYLRIKNVLVFFRKYYPYYLHIGAFLSFCAWMAIKIKRRQPLNLKSMLTAYYDVLIK
jgi:hypothetical protein